MSVLREHIRWHRELLDVPGVVASPMLMFGYQDVLAQPILSTPTRLLSLRRYKHLVPTAVGERVARLVRPHLHRAPRVVPVADDFAADDLVQLLRGRGVDVTVLDLFDPRADLRFDMNDPVPVEHEGRYASVIDIGSLEHVFDTRQALDNCLRMVRVGGVYVLHTPVKGYAGHGLHTFHQQGLVDAVTLNGFEVVYRQLTTNRGAPVTRPADADEVLLWLVARKVATYERFTAPQQGEWEDWYGGGNQSVS